MKQKMFLGVSILRKFGMEFLFFWGGGGMGEVRFSPGIFSVLLETLGILGGF